MKVRIDIDCSPEEARAFLGLPDTGPLQQEMLDKMREQFLRNLETMNADELMKLWMPGGKDALQTMQEAFMAQMAQFTGTAKKNPKKE